MKLPTLSYPTYEMITTIDKTKIKYRPFLTGEEKILYLAMKTKESGLIKNAVMQVLNNCIITPGITAEKLAIFDLEKLFLLIRGKSVGESIDLKVACKDEPDVMIPVSIPIDEITIKIPDGHTNTIKINDETTLVMKYPGLDMFLSDNFIDDNEAAKTMFELATDCISQLICGDDVFKFEEYPVDERNKFVEGLPSKIFGEIGDFFNTMPRLYFDVSVVNPNTQVVTTVRLECVESFFD